MYDNKWLIQNCPKVDDFIVDKTKDKYYIQYAETNSRVMALHHDWKVVSDYTDMLKAQIDELNNSIDSEDYKSKTNDIIISLTESQNALSINFTKLFGSVVRRLEESAQSDEWFSDEAQSYASYISSTILGVTLNSGKQRIPNLGDANASPVQQPTSSPINSVPLDNAISGGNTNPSINLNSVGNSNSGANQGFSGNTNSNNAESNYGNNSDSNSSNNYSSQPSSPSNSVSSDITESNNSNGSAAPMNGGNEEPLTATSVQYSSLPTGNNNGLVDIGKYSNKPEKGFVVTTDNPKYNLSDSDIELITAIVSAESDKSYDDALAVASTIFNRCETPKWASCGGSNPVKQATAKNQFVVYQHGSYKKYMGSGAPDTCRQAVMDAMNGVRNHKYLSFRSNGSTRYSSNMITSSGNRYK